MCARLTVLSETPIADAIAGCAKPSSRSNTIRMRWRCFSGMFFQRSGFLSRRTSPLLHLIVGAPNQRGSANHIAADKIRHQTTANHPIQSAPEAV
jgi:hypothetical protein